MPGPATTRKPAADHPWRSPTFRFTPEQRAAYEAKRREALEQKRLDDISRRTIAAKENGAADAVQRPLPTPRRRSRADHSMGVETTAAHLAWAKEQARRKRWQERAVARRVTKLAAAADAAAERSRNWTPERRAELMAKSKAIIKAGKTKLNRKPVRRVSAKKAKSDRLYNAMVKEWLGRYNCVVGAAVVGIPQQRATQCHHSRGRLGTLKFDQRFWLPVSADGHRWIHDHAAQARKLYLIADVGDWHRAPDDAETARLRQWMDAEGIL